MFVYPCYYQNGLKLVYFTWKQQLEFKIISLLFVLRLWFVGALCWHAV